MNNEQFRRLAFGSGSSSSTNKDATSSSNGATPSAAPAVLGSRQRSSIPMTPRAGGSVSQLAFSKQMAERFGQGTDKQKQQQQKKSKLSAPKGSRFAAGYVDRAKLRAEHENDNDSTSVPKGLDLALLGRARNGEDVLEDVLADKKEEQDVESKKDGPQAEAGPDVDEEFERLEKVEVQAVEKEKAKKKGQYSTTTAAVAGQKRSRDQILAELKAAREAAKAAQAAQAAAEPVLGSRFKKIGANSTGHVPGHVPGSSRIERDSRGREVLVIVDEDGREKRKVRKLAPGAGVARDSVPTERATTGASEPKPDGEVLGMEVPEFYRKKLEAEAAAEAEKEVNIFDDAGSDYDPLAGMGSGSESGSESDAEADKEPEKRVDTQRGRSRSSSPRRYRDRKGGEASDSDSSRSRYSQNSRNSRSRDSRSRESRDYRRGDVRHRSRSAQPKPAASTSASTSTSQPASTAVEAGPRRSYFGSSKLLSDETRGGASLNDPSVLAALRKAKQLREAAEAEEKTKAMSKEAEREARLKQLLQNSERDAEDLDLEFSVSRGGVEVEEEGEDRVRFSKWKGRASGGDDEDEDDDGGGKGGGQGKRKRGGKKRKGDGNNVADVMRVLESRKGGSK